MPDNIPAGEPGANPGAPSQSPSPGGQPSGGAPAPSPTPQPGTGGTPAPGATTGAPAGQPGAGGQPSTFSYPEDRANWIPPYRLQEVSSRAQQIERQLAVERARVRALAGFEPQPASIEDQLTPEEREIRNGMFKLFPWLKDMEQHAGNLSKIAPQADNLLSRGDEGWVREGHRTLRTLSTEFAKEIGAESLTPGQQRRVGTLFQNWLESDPQLAQRYAYGDDKLIGEFIDDLRNDFLAPVRRQGQAGAEGAAGAVAGQPRPPAQGQVVPQPRQQPSTHDAPPNEDDVHAAAFAGMRRALGR